MNKKEVIEALVKKTGVDKSTVAKVYPAVFDLIAVSMKKEDFKVDGFGVFKVKKTKARKGRNPATGEIVNIPAKKKVAFRPSKALKEKLLK